MTNQELYDLIKELRKELRDGREADSQERAAMAKEFYLFKGKAFGFIGLLSVVSGFISSYFLKD